MSNGDVKVFGRHIVADPEVCHGQLTFVGTRILVETVLDQVADGLAWETIVNDWRGKVSKEAITEAVRLAREALLIDVAEGRLRAIRASSAAG